MSSSPRHIPPPPKSLYGFDRDSGEVPPPRKLGASLKGAIVGPSTLAGYVIGAVEIEGGGIEKEHARAGEDGGTGEGEDNRSPAR
eukprot:CAMPEP_0184675552 /NCGR_PEP_ID=MMETSP0308-20130426/87849_1 /TAXON_ID=38269 /ORGANISM="Gloeochaete witrockiana, Strain SAG 46.84" /LENGTH=84 /DNA_ID=CAMNT_0027123265 /DNA_START=132 /DNA_END=387 /DNA_ORIENTATION=-